MSGVCSRGMLGFPWKMKKFSSNLASDIGVFLKKLYVSNEKNLVL